MSSSRSPREHEQSDAESVILKDEAGRSLECHVEKTFEVNGSSYLLLLPVDTPVSILAWEDEETEEAILIDDEEELDRIFPDAKAVLEEQNLNLKRTAYTLTVVGELPAVEEDDILTLEVEDDNLSSEPEEFQYLASFYYEEEEYGIYTPLSPLLFFARKLPDGSVELLSPEEFRKVQPLLEEWMFDEFEE